MKRLLLILLLAVAVLASAGCVTTNLNSNVSENVDLDALNTFYVVRLEADERGVEQLIAEALRQRGLTATAGSINDQPQGVDVVVSYRDRWMWDITMYMMEIAIEFRDPQDGVIIAEGTSFRTSLARKSPEFMIDEVLGDIFKN